MSSYDIEFNVNGTVRQTIVPTVDDLSAQDLIAGLKDGSIVTPILSVSDDCVNNETPVMRIGSDGSEEPVGMVSNQSFHDTEVEGFSLDEEEDADGEEDED